MPAGYFRIRKQGGATWYSWKLNNWPKPLNRTPQIVDPRPTKRTGTGIPTGAFGKPRALLKLPWCQAGGDWDNVLLIYAGLPAGQEYAPVEVELRDVRTEAWKMYTGYAMWPAVKETIQLTDGTNWYIDPEIEIVNLVASE